MHNLDELSCNNQHTLIGCVHFRNQKGKKKVWLSSASQNIFVYITWSLNPAPFLSSVCQCVVHVFIQIKQYFRNGVKYLSSFKWIFIFSCLILIEILILANKNRFLFHQNLLIVLYRTWKCQKEKKRLTQLNALIVFAVFLVQVTNFISKKKKNLTHIGVVQSTMRWMHEQVKQTQPINAISRVNVYRCIVLYIKYQCSVCEWDNICSENKRHIKIKTNN